MSTQVNEYRNGLPCMDHVWYRTLVAQLLGLPAMTNELYVVLLAGVPRSLRVCNFSIFPSDIDASFQLMRWLMTAELMQLLDGTPVLLIILENAAFFSARCLTEEQRVIIHTSWTNYLTALHHAPDEERTVEQKGNRV